MMHKIIAEEELVSKLVSELAGCRLVGLYNEEIILKKRRRDLHKTTSINGIRWQWFSTDNRTLLIVSPVVHQQNLALGSPLTLDRLVSVPCLPASDSPSRLLLFSCFI